jgi:hypothetical protein
MSFEGPTYSHRHRSLCLGFVATVVLACGASSQEAAAPQTSEPAAQAAPPEAADDGGGQPESVVTRAVSDFDVAARNGTATPEARAFIRDHDKQLTNIYVDRYGELSAKTRVALVNLLVSFQTDATVPALAAAITRYAHGQASVDEAIWACQAAKKIKSAELASALMTAFDAIDMSDEDAQRFSRHLADAMEWNVVPSWSAVLEKHRDATIEPLDSFEDTAEVRAYRNQKYWKETSARLLDRLHAEKAE